MADGTGYVFTHPQSAVELRYPKGGFTADPGAARPGYFRMSDPATGLVVSGWFEPAHRFAGMEKFWESEAAGLASNGMPAQDVVQESVGDWQVVFYDNALPGIVSAHLRAERVMDGTWVDLHLSITAAAPGKELRARLKEQLGKMTLVAKAKPSR